MSKADRSEDLERLLEEILQNDGDLKKLASESQNATSRVPADGKS